MNSKLKLDNIPTWDEACQHYKPHREWVKVYGHQGWGWGSQLEVPCDTCGVKFRWHPYCLTPPKS